MSNNQRIITPDITGYIQNRKQDIKNEINCISIGTIDSFDPITQTVNIYINFLRVVIGGSAASAPDTDQTQDKKYAYPILVRCPLMILNGGGAAITFPVAQGDTCIVLFCDKDMDTWWSTGGIAAPNSQRVHDLNDAIVIIGIKSLSNAITGYFNGFKIGYGLASITIDPLGHIVISGTTVSINP